MTEPICEQTLLAMPESDYMGPAQRGFFRDRLQRLAREGEQARQSARQSLRTVAQADPLDVAVEEEACRHQLRFLERSQALQEKIFQALRRVESGEYGFCRLSGEPIGIARLLARPTTEYCAEVKARLEQNERHYAHQRTG